MTDNAIFDAAEEHGWLDDFGRWNFKDDGLLDFVIAVARAEREACAKMVEPLDESLADEIRARGKK